MLTYALIALFAACPALLPILFGIIATVSVLYGVLVTIIEYGVHIVVIGVVALAGVLLIAALERLQSPGPRFA